MTGDAAKLDLTRRRLLVGTGSNAAAQIVVLGTWFFLTPFVLGKLGVTTYGLWILVSSVVAYGSLLDFGMGNAIVKYVAEYRARHEDDAVNELIATAVRLYSILGIVAFLLSVALAISFNTLFPIASGDLKTAQALVVVTGAGFGIGLAFTPLLAMLRGLHRFDLSNAVSVTGSLFSAIATLLVLSAGGGIVEMVAVNIPITVGVRVVTVRVIARIGPEIRYSWRGASRRMTRILAGYGSAMFLGQISGQLQQKMDEVVVGALLTISAVTPYSLAHRLSDVASLLTSQFIRVLLPIASELDAQGERQHLRTLYILSTRVTTAVVVMLALPLLILPGEILTAWVGPGYASGAPLVMLLALAAIIGMPQWPAAALMQGIGRYRVLAISALATGIANLVLSVMLAQSLGIIGVALGTLIPTTIESLVVVLPYSIRQMNVRGLDVLRSVFIPALIPAVPMAAIVFVLGRWLAAYSLLGIGLACIAGALVYVGVYLAVPATHPERNFVRDIIRRSRR